MTINPTTTTNPLTAAVTASGVTGQNSDVLGKDAFMQLLVTKMQNQDPTAPQDDAALITQLATFSSLEQMQQMNTTLTSIAGFFSDAKDAAAVTSAANAAATTAITTAAATTATTDTSTPPATTTAPATTQP